MFTVMSINACDDAASSTTSPTVPGPRLITFAPALTQMAIDMGLGDQVVGVDRYSDRTGLPHATVVGDFLNVRVEPIVAVTPDVILFNMQPRHFETLGEVAPSIKQIHVRLDDLADVSAAMRTIAIVAGKPEAGEKAAQAFEAELEEVAARTADLPPKRVMYVIGHTQMMAVGGDSFTGEMIERAGGHNVLQDEFRDWKEPSLERVIELAPEVVICQSDPEHAAEAKAYWQQLFSQAGLQTRVEVVTDPKWTQQAGHLAAYTRQLATMLHPEIADD